jgi:hypothetical protein
MTRVTGVTIDDRWFCSRDCVERMVRRRLSGIPAAVHATPVPTPPHLRLGVLLRHSGALSADQLHQVLETQRRTGLKLGEQAKSMYGVESAQVLRALAAQAGARYLTAIDPATVHDAPGGLSREAIEALGLIPFSEPDERLAVRVASKAPVRWDAVQALRRLSDWMPELYLVGDDTWDDLLTHYGANPRQASRRRAEPADAVFVRSPHEAATTIATIAAAGRRVNLLDAHWDSYSWVRVLSGQSTQDVLFTRTPAEEMTWREVNTSR